ncbi:DUF1365 domain-containing protein [Paracoccus spongiarum]|uniref:DUF1365 domain-containing protein n=1 Tax=Paracoccus spongiarum TaxID=3064387 RepID=A0ABT9JGE3_9RHOB|nr:DUF1365 domain-containing protein [Paracoccus sp. 2205BS29-5]MDP5308904.1 DUF1365 domain-containing protein [Paracoccus sp. 2205BS29-5]
MSVDLWDGALIDARIWHARSGDVARSFRYRAVYAALPLPALEAGVLPLRLDRRGLWRIRRRDLGWRDGRGPGEFIGAILRPVGLGGADVTLVTLPRSLGHGFNPVSFWLARDGQGLRAVLAEVSNTFGERHLYLCRHADNRVIAEADRMVAEKLFHVSPFLPRSGRYEFRFDARPGRFGAWIDWFGEAGDLRLQTSMTGRARPLTAGSLRGAMLRHPFQGLKVTGLIHWQALQLALRGVRYSRKPRQLDRSMSEAQQRGADRDV